MKLNARDHAVSIYRTNLFFRSSLLLNNQLYLFLKTLWTEATMTAPISFAHSPFLYQHVPNSPFLLPRRRQVTQSPAPFVPDIDTPRENRYTGGVLLQNGKEKDCFGHTIKKVNRNVWCIMFNIRMVTVNNNSPIQDYVHPDDQTQPTFEMTPGLVQTFQRHTHGML